MRSIMQAAQKKGKMMGRSFSGDIYCDACDEWIALSGPPAEVLQELREAMRRHECDEEDEGYEEEYD